MRGQKIRADESVCLFYPSANRDEEVFDQPFKFDIGRNPNPCKRRRENPSVKRPDRPDAPE